MPAFLWAKGLYEARGHPRPASAVRGRLRRGKAGFGGQSWAGLAQNGVSACPGLPYTLGGHGPLWAPECVEGLCVHECTQTSPWKGTRVQGTGVCEPAGARVERSLGAGPPPRLVQGVDLSR